MPPIQPHRAQDEADKAESGVETRPKLTTRSVSWAILIALYVTSALVVAIVTALIVYYTRRANESSTWVSSAKEASSSSPSSMYAVSSGQLVQVAASLATVTGRVYDENGVYVEALSDPMSEDHRQTEGDVCHKWTDIYQGLNYRLRECHVDSFSPGSLIYDLRLAVSHTDLGQEVQVLPDLGGALNATDLRARLGLRVETSHVTTASHTFLVSGKGLVYNACGESDCAEICLTQDPTSFRCHCFSGASPLDNGTCPGFANDADVNSGTYRYIEGDISSDRPAYQSSTSMHPVGHASLAVDGEAESCSRSLNTAAPWWSVDLGREARVFNVSITNTPTEGERLHDVLIGVTDVTPIDGMQITPDQFAVTLCSRIELSVPNGATAMVQCPEGGVAGRYLVIQLDHGSVSNGLDTYLALCEVHAYGYAYVS